ncbi:MAG: agmatine deiminase family protein [Bacteroidales bacterium]
MLRIFTIFLLLTLSSIGGFSQNLVDPTNMPHEMTPGEVLLKETLGSKFVSTPPPTGVIRNIAEFDKMEGVLIRYPLGITTSLVAAMSQDLKVWAVLDSSIHYNNANNSFTNAGVNMSNVVWVNAPTNSHWTRDYGPWFIHYGNHELGIVDFPYNRPSRPLDDSIPKVIAEKMNLPWFGMNLIHTGGNYMTLGSGVSASTDLVIDENDDNYTPVQIDSIAYNYLGINTYHKVADPNNTYIDHIDCWGKYLAPDKVLIRSVPPTHPQYNAIESTATYFASQLSPNGTPFKLYRVYTPGNQPYTNSIILNNKVFVPIIGNIQYDTAALHVYQQALPGYTVQGFTGSWESTDALHCRTIGLADRSMLEILHNPVLGNQPVLPQFNLSAEIFPYSGAGLFEDSVMMYYKVNNGTYTPVLMNNAGNNIWESVIPGQVNGTVVSYYLSAVDSAGNRAYHPFIGSYDPHLFNVGSVGINEHNAASLFGDFNLKISPNPFRNVCHIEFNLNEISPVSIDIYDFHGKLIRNIIQQPLGAGRHYFCWDGNGISNAKVANGMYYLRLNVSGTAKSKKIIYQGN